MLRLFYKLLKMHDINCVTGSNSWELIVTPQGELISLVGNWSVDRLLALACMIIQWLGLHADLM